MLTQSSGIETSVTGKFKIRLIKAADFDDAMIVQDFPLGETADTWIVHGFTHTDYLEDFAPGEEGGVYGDSALDPAMKVSFNSRRTGTSLPESRLLVLTFSPSLHCIEYLHPDA